MVRFIALLAWYPESAGCEVHHASAGGDSPDRLIVLTALGVADEDGISGWIRQNLLIRVTVLKVPRNTFLLPMPGN